MSSLSKRKRLDESGSGRSEKRTIEIKKNKTDPRHQDSRTAFYAEENEVLLRNPKRDLDMYKNACDEIRRCMAEIHHLKSSDAKNKAAEIEELRITVSLQFLVLKKLNRLSHLRCKKVRDKTSERRQKTDEYHLQLQNLLYEVMHLQKEITKCLEFKSKDEEIELVSVEEFFLKAPADISKLEITKADEHQLTLARLDWELEQRKRLSDKLKETQQSKESISGEIKTTQEQLESLQPKLTAILETTKPVQEYLNMPFDLKREQYAQARHLVDPLYVLFMQASAYQDACDKDLTVTIEGDIEAAKLLVSISNDDIEDEDDDSDQEETDKRKSKRRRKTVSDRMNQKKEKVLKKHPMSVILTIKCQDGSNLTLKFDYLLMLKIATVSIKTNFSKSETSGSSGDLLLPETILSCLYTDDDGSSTPNPANKFELQQVGIYNIKDYLTNIGHPYMWAQWLSGLEFLPDSNLSMAQSNVSSGHMQETIGRIRQRVLSRLALQKQLAALEAGCVPMESVCTCLFPNKTFCRLSSWKRLTLEDYEVIQSNKCYLESGLVKDSDYLFLLEAERGSAKLKASVVISPNYPSTAPLFSVEVTWKTTRTNVTDENIAAMEAELNLHYKELLTEASPCQLLANQVQRLLVCFDVYIDTDSDPDPDEGPSEFSRERVYCRHVRGPNRIKPYKYNVHMGIFLHR